MLETEQPGVTVLQVARAHRIITSVLARWRAELGFYRSQPANLAAVQIANAQQRGTQHAGQELAARRKMLPIPPGAIALEFAEADGLSLRPEAIRKSSGGMSRARAEDAGDSAARLNLRRPTCCTCWVRARYEHDTLIDPGSVGNLVSPMAMRALSGRVARASRISSCSVDNAPRKVSVGTRNDHEPPPDGSRSVHVSASAQC